MNAVIAIAPFSTQAGTSCCDRGPGQVEIVSAAGQVRLFPPTAPIFRLAAPPNHRPNLILRRATALLEVVERKAFCFGFKRSFDRILRTDGLEKKNEERSSSIRLTLRGEAAVSLVPSSSENKSKSIKKLKKQ